MPGRNGDDSLYALWRLLSDAKVDGGPHTNATWFRPATRAYVVGAERVPFRWYWLPRLVREIIRVAGLAAGVAVAYAYVQAPELTLNVLVWAVSITFAVSGLAGGWLGAGSLLTWRHRRQWVWPLHAALHRRLGYPERFPPRRYLTVPQSFHESDDEPVVVRLPADFAGEDRQQDTVASIVRTKLALGDVTMDYRLTGRDHYLQVKPKVRPPARAMFADSAVREAIEAARESAPLIGLTSGDRPVAISLDEESPHILFSASTGGGKSAMLRVLTAQLMHSGAACSVIDIKRHSHRWARGLAGVDYWRDVEQMHHGLIALVKEGERRNRVADDWDGNGRGPRFTRHVLLLEEANATINKLNLWWQANRGRDDPPRSPAVLALNDILYMGRAVRIHVLLVAQLATANALGGPAVRECFTARVLARATRNAWGMLAPEINPVPKSSRHAGRAHVVIAGQAIETQVVFMTEAEAREWAASGTPCDVTASQVEETPDSQGNPPVTVTGRPPLRAVPDVNGTPERVSLRDASSDHGRGVVQATLESLRAARHRDPEFPSAAGKRGQADVFAVHELARWERGRPNAGDEEG